MQDGVAWCAGTHEYKPMGVAVISASTLFAARDFDPARRRPARDHAAFHGFFASLTAVNSYLSKGRSQGERKFFRQRNSPIKSIL
jgi:hypothetical protein